MSGHNVVTAREVLVARAAMLAAVSGPAEGKPRGRLETAAVARQSPGSPLCSVDAGRTDWRECSKVQCSGRQHGTVQHSTVQYSTARQNTVHHSIVSAV